MRTQTMKMWGGLCLALALSAAAAGCGNATKSSSGAGDAATVGSAAQGKFDAAANVEALYKGTFTSPPTTSPTPQAGKKIWVISVDQSISAASNTTAGMQASAKVLGWDLKVFDSKSDPATANNGIRQAVSAGADGIVLLYWDCSAIKAGLLTAEQAHVTTVAIEGVDCDKPLFDHIVTYNTIPDFYGSLPGTYVNDSAVWERTIADYVIAKAGNHAKILFVTETDLSSTKRATEAGLDELSKCSGCEVVQAKIQVTDYGPGLQQKVQQALLQNKDIDAVLVENDAMLSTGTIAALKGANLWGKVIIGGGEGSAEMVPLMRTYPTYWGFGVFPVEWEGAASLDALNRMFNNEKPGETGIGLQLVDKDHNLPAQSDVLVPTHNGQPIDYAGIYRSAWTG